MRKERLFNNLFDYIDFNPDANVDCKEGRVKWNKDYYTMDICTGLGPINQAGQELYTIVYNDSGFDIGDGKAVYLSGVASGYPTITKAISDTHRGLLGAVYITTMVIPNGSVGVVTQFGRVQNIDTSGFSSVGATLYVSPTIAGDLTETRPEFPDYEYAVGAVEVKDASNGVLSIDIRADVDDTFENYWNGSFRESFDFRVTESGGTVTGTLTPTNGHDDMTMIFSDGLTTLNVGTAPANNTINLTPYVGTDTDPVEVYVWITKTAKTLAAGFTTPGWPSEEHIRVARLVLQSASTVGTQGAFRNQNMNDHLVDTDSNQGHNSHIGERIRAMSAEWFDGAEATMSAGGNHISTTQGRVYQMHLQTILAQSMPTDDIHVVNDFDAAYTTITDLDSITKDSTGTPLSNSKYYSLVVWGVANKSGEKSHLMLNLPSGFYQSDELAMSDALGYANYTIPDKFKGTGFLIARFVMQYNNPGWTYGGVLTGYQDLRGFVPNSTAGSGAGASGITTFLGLTDTPASYTANKLVKVNSGATALEYSASDESNYALNDGTRKFVCPNGATVPSPAVANQVFCHSPTGRTVYMQYDGSNWIPLNNIGSTVLYVDGTLGADLIDKGGASGSGAFKTIQYALDSLGGSVGGDVTINIAAGDYDEDVVIQGKSLTGNYTIALQGTLELLESVANASVTNGLNATYTTVASTSLDGDDYTGKLCYLSDQGIYRVIDDHTSSGGTGTMTLVDNTASGATTQNITVYGWDTLVQSITVRSLQGAVVLKDMKVDGVESDLGVYGVLLKEGAFADMERICFDVTASQSFFVAFSSTASATDCVADKKSTIQGKLTLFRYKSDISGGQALNVNGGGILIMSDVVTLRSTSSGSYTGVQGAESCNITFQNKYSKIEDFSIGVYSLSGAIVKATTNIQYSGNTTNENAVAAEYALIL